MLKTQNNNSAKAEKSSTKLKVVPKNKCTFLLNKKAQEMLVKIASCRDIIDDHLVAVTFTASQTKQCIESGLIEPEMVTVPPSIDYQGLLHLSMFLKELRYVNSLGKQE